MLVLSRKLNERIVIGPNVTITVIDICGNRVKVGVDAPADVAIHRQEVYCRIEHEKQDRTSREPPELSRDATY